MTEKYGTNAKGAIVTKALKDLLRETPNNTESADEVIIFFSGHGQGLGEKQAANAYLVAQDCDPNAPGDTCIALDWLASLIHNTNVRSVLALLDACYAGAFGAVRMGTSSAQPSSPQAYERLAKEKARQVLTAGRPGEQVYMVPQLRMSAFTKYLVVGISSQAFPSSGVLLASELASFVKNRVINDPYVQGAQIPRFYEEPLATGEAIFRLADLKTIEAPVIADQPVQAVPVRFLPKHSINGTITATVERRDSYRETRDFYRRTPGDNCSQQVGVSDGVDARAGYNIVNANLTITLTRGDRTRLNPLSVTGTSARATGTVQGDDDVLGFCKRPGELGFQITVLAERWTTESLPVFPVSASENNDRTWVFQFPETPHGQDVRNLQFSYAVEVTRRDGDLSRNIRLTDTGGSAESITTQINTNGRLIINASAP